MIYYTCKKLFGGNVSVRDYVVKFAKKTGQIIELTLEINGQKMRINGDTPYRCDRQTFYTKRADSYIKKDKPYQLWDYTWSPQTIEPEDINMDGRMAMLKAWKELQNNKNKQLNIEEVIKK